MTKERAIEITRELFITNLKNSILFEKISDSTIEEVLEEENLIIDFVNKVFNDNSEYIDEINESEFVEGVRFDIKLLCYVIKNNIFTSIMTPKSVN